MTMLRTCRLLLRSGGGFSLFSSLAVAQENPPAPAPTPTPAPETGSIMGDGLTWLQRLFTHEVAENTYGQIALSLLVLIAAVLFRRIIVAFLFGRLKALASRTRTSFDDHLFDALQGPAGAIVLVLGVFFSLGLLSLDPQLDLFILKAFQAAILVVVFWGFLRAIDVLAEIGFAVAKQRDLGIYPFIPLIKKTARVFFMIIGVILIVQNLGYSVGSLLAGLGIGGLAVALAAQDSLSNFFGSLVVAVDRPFKLGEVVRIGSAATGVVEEIGLRSTRIRTAQKSLITVPNKMMASEVIENLSVVQKRRIEFTIGITYETEAGQMEELVAALRQILNSDEGVDPELRLVTFTNFGASSLDIYVAYYTATSDWLKHHDVRERVNLKIMREIERRGLALAFPTQTIHLEGDIARKLAEGRAPAPASAPPPPPPLEIKR